MNNTSFHSFPKLPPELRFLIWQLCLPHRTPEEDVPYFLLDGNESRQACWAESSTYQNAQPPTIAFVNRESRSVAFEQGHERDTTEKAWVLSGWTDPPRHYWNPFKNTSLGSIWVQPRRDAWLQLNWTRLLYHHMLSDFDDFSPIGTFLWLGKDLGLPHSVVADIILPFSLEVLLDGDDGADASKSPSFEFEWNEEFIKHYDTRELAFATLDAERPNSLGTVMAAVSLHITREEALMSGLFGLLGDAPVQVVDFNDTARLREFDALFGEHASGREPTVQRLFETFTSTRFRAAVRSWMRRAEWLIMASMWQQSQTQIVEQFGTGPGEVWIPELPKFPDPPYTNMDKHLFNEEHPWVKRARQIMPRLRPQIMVRCCHNECYRPERLPEGFGEYPT
ncbi:hypothetical protein QQS21_011591 [Conoideocrella luteorostrata]|uniref:2EXR domain-containing protein n=1 Tax=Conoideocrella luteorostrata TaxID=1105319 RepID=A0AAJ0CCU9_9HYPO|nr:hypothetical protein QQS21_011591 [Conoideocrella luteorostrata]